MISENSSTKSGMKENFLNTLIIYICVKNKNVHAFYSPHYILFKHVLKRLRKHINSLYLHIKFLYVYKLLNLCYLYIVSVNRQRTLTLTFPYTISSFPLILSDLFFLFSDHGRWFLVSQLLIFLFSIIIIVIVFFMFYFFHK